MNACIDEILSNPGSLYLSDLKNKNETIFLYTIGVLTTSLCLGVKFGYNKEELIELGLGALNYDIGMLSIPENILKKETKLNMTEQEILNNHTIYGYEMLSEISCISPKSTIIALSHHENQDGTGYPRGLKGNGKPPTRDYDKSNKIYSYAEIVSLADHFDMYCYGRKHFSEALGVEEAVKKLVSLKKSKFNPYVLSKFLELSPIYTVGMRVRIKCDPVNNMEGYYAVVSDINDKHPYGPKIVIYESPSRLKIKPIKVDLSKFKGIKIQIIS